MRFTGVVPSVNCIIGDVLHDTPATLTDDCTRVTVIALSNIQLVAVHVVVRAPGKNIGGNDRGEDVKATSPPNVIELTVHAAVIQSVPLASG